MAPRRDVGPQRAPRALQRRGCNEGDGDTSGGESAFDDATGAAKGERACRAFPGPCKRRPGPRSVARRGGTLTVDRAVEWPELGTEQVKKKKAEAKARVLLEKTGADVLVWGSVISLSGKSAMRLGARWHVPRRRAGQGSPGKCETTLRIAGLHFEIGAFPQHGTGSIRAASGGVLRQAPAMGLRGGTVIRQRVTDAVGWPKSAASAGRRQRRMARPMVPEPSAAS